MSVTPPPHIRAPKEPLPLIAGFISISIKDVWWVSINELKVESVIIAYISENGRVFGLSTEKPSRDNMWQPKIIYHRKHEIRFIDLQSFNPLPGYPEAIIG